MQKLSPLGRFVFALILASGFLAHSACGGSKASPTGPGVVPTATPTPTPASPPATPPAGASSACDRLPKVDVKSACNEAKGSFSTEISDAIDRVIANYPALFELQSTNERGDPHIRDREGYFRAVISELDKAGICGGWKSGEIEIQVTTSNDFSDTYHVITGMSYPWRGLASYVDTCVPAALPKITVDHIDWVFVTAYGVVCDPGAGVDNPFVRGNRAEIPMGCEASITATPKTFGGLDVPLSVHGTDVQWDFVTGEAVFWQWPDQPFNVNISPRNPGPLKICATIQGVTGCLDGAVVP